MPPQVRPIPCHIAEPPHELEPSGRWGEQLARRFLSACAEIETEEQLTQPQADAISWYPERTLEGRTYVPATARTSENFEVYGYVAFDHGPGGEPSSFLAHADYTDETAEANPDWQVDLSDEEIGSWRGAKELKANIALGYVRREHNAMGTKLDGAEIVQLPFVNPETAL